VAGSSALPYQTKIPTNKKIKPTVILTAALLCALSPISFAKPIKGYILSGQSNMQGHANTSTFDYIGNHQRKK